MRGPSGPLTAELAGMEIADGHLHVGLLTADGVTTVALELDAASCEALPAVVALHGHGRDCPNSVDVHVGLVLRTVRALAGGEPRLVVRPGVARRRQAAADSDGGGEPIMVLRVPGADEREIALSTLDACCLLCSGQMTIVVEPAR